MSAQAVNNPTPEYLVDACRQMVLAAGKVIRDMREDAVQTATTKSSPTDPVTAADRAAEELIVDAILQDRPDDSIVGEEGANRAGSSPVSWHIDPIDGTTNYLYGYPAYAVSVAAEIDDVITAGAVLNAATGDLFSACRGQTSVCNDDPISVTQKAELGSALIGTGFNYLAERRTIQAEVLVQILPEIRDIRRGGSAALDLCSVASGQLDAYFESGLNKWDYAAGWIIVEQAGGVCSGLNNPVPSPAFTVASGPKLHQQLTNMLVESGSERLL